MLICTLTDGLVTYMYTLVFIIHSSQHIFVHLYIYIYIYTYIISTLQCHLSLPHGNLTLDRAFRRWAAGDVAGISSFGTEIRWTSHCWRLLFQGAGICRDETYILRFGTLFRHFFWDLPSFWVGCRIFVLSNESSIMSAGKKYINKGGSEILGLDLFGERKQLIFHQHQTHRGTAHLEPQWPLFLKGNPPGPKV